MEFNFLDNSKLEVTSYSYDDFDIITKSFGYELSNDLSLHNYFDWTRLKHWSFDFESYTESDLSNLFKKAEVVKERIVFFVRLLHHLPIVKVNSIALSEMLDDLTHESGMGWEAISTCGKYILEFTDGYEHMAKSNFKILEIG